MKIRHIIFDFDGTLADTRRNIVMTLQGTLQALGLPIADEEACVATIGLPLRDCFVQLLPNETAKIIDACTDFYRELFEINKKKLVPDLFPNVLDTIHTLHSQGYTLSIASSRSSKSLAEFVSDLNLADEISYFVGANDVEKAKPNAEPVLKILDKLKIKADESLVVGDMPVDIQMGKNAGTFTCAVSYGNADKQILTSANPDFIIDDMSELLNIIL